MTAMEDYRVYYRSSLRPELDPRYINPPNNFFSDYHPPVFTAEEQLIAEEEATVKRYISMTVGWVSLIAENLICHPFVVLRRQCQVNNIAKNFHVVPYSLLPIIVKLHQRQGITTLWKGIGSVLLIRGMTMAIEDLLSKITPWPKEVDTNSSLKSFFHHILLKCISLAIVTPFYSASLVETVQSDIASEKPGILDVFKEGAVRLVHWGLPKRGRLLPIWALVIPSVALGITRHLFMLSVRGGYIKLLQAKEKYATRRRGAFPKAYLSGHSSQDDNVNATLVSLITTDILFYPFETVLHRLHLQGTRSIIDNLDSGYSVLPILTNYEGAFDCYDKCVTTEGSQGFFKGFGALILQYTVHITLVRGTRFLLTKVSRFMRSTPRPVQCSSPPVIYPSNDLTPHSYYES